jgi:hypothetical protein
MKRTRPIPKAASLARRHRAAGYTVVEILVSMAVLAVGVIGIIATQKVTIASNTHAKNLAVATHIAQSWLGVLEAEASLWGEGGGLTRTTWLSQGAGTTTWFRPNYDGTRIFGPAFDAIGNPVRTQDENPNARFCADLRFSPLNNTANNAGLIRVEVRVIWLRDQAILSGTATATPHACGVNVQNVLDPDQRRVFHFVHMSGAVRQVVAGT